MNLYENQKYMEDVRYVAGLKLPWEKLEGKSILVTGDGRSEISAGLALGALTISRLNPDAARQRELHESLGTHIMVEDFDDPLLEKVFRKV